jgi:arsenate reductase (thioredoxin)
MNFLFLCTHNSARSILAEGMFNQLARELGLPHRAYSAGSAASGRVQPLALEVLHAAGIPTADFKSESWDVYAAANAPPLHAVITVCDSAAAETCPIWPGAPVQAHWGFPDPSRAAGDEAARRIAFDLTRQAFGYKLLRLFALPIEQLQPADLRTALQVISLA